MIESRDWLPSRNEVRFTFSFFPSYLLVAVIKSAMVKEGGRAQKERGKEEGWEGSAFTGTVLRWFCCLQAGQECKTDSRTRKLVGFLEASLLKPPTRTHSDRSFDEDNILNYTKLTSYYEVHIPSLGSSILDTPAEGNAITFHYTAPTGQFRWPLPHIGTPQACAKCSQLSSQL